MCTIINNMKYIRLAIKVVKYDMYFNHTRKMHKYVYFYANTIKGYMRLKHSEFII